MQNRNHSHYFKDVSHLSEIDVYRVIDLFNVTDPCLQHALKKILVPGGRGAGKGNEKDVREAIDSLNRFLQMRAEDCNAGILKPRTVMNMQTSKPAIQADPAAQLLNETAVLLNNIEGQRGSLHSVRIQCRALLQKIQLLRLAPFVADRSEAAVAQGVDLTTEELSKARAALPQFKDRVDVNGEEGILPNG